MEKTLYKLSKEDKMLVSIIRAENKGAHWELWKETGQRDGQKVVHAPDIIEEGKAKRTLEQQVKLQFDSLVNKNKDKGYKETEEEASNSKGTDASGVPKPMLALDPKKQDASFWTKNKWYVSRKLDGVRCLIGKMDGEVLAISRMGKDYSVSARFIIEDLADTLAIMADGEFLDGELYVHEKSLQNISGLTRDQKPTQVTPSKWPLNVLVCLKVAASRKITVLSALQLASRLLRADEKRTPNTSAVWPFSLFTGL